MACRWATPAAAPAHRLVERYSQHLGLPMVVQPRYFRCRATMWQVLNIAVD